MQIDTRLTEDDLQATILAVLRRYEMWSVPVLLRDLTRAVKLALETGGRVEKIENIDGDLSATR